MADHAKKQSQPIQEKKAEPLRIYRIVHQSHIGLRPITVCLCLTEEVAKAMLPADKPELRVEPVDVLDEPVPLIRQRHFCSVEFVPGQRGPRCVTSEWSEEIYLWENPLVESAEGLFWSDFSPSDARASADAYAARKRAERMGG